MPFKGIFCAALVSIAPAALIHHKDLNSYFSNLHWSVIIFFSLSIIAGSISFISLPSLPTKKAIFAIGYLFFYTACAALCQRIGLTSFVVDPRLLEPNHLSIYSCPLTTMPGTILISLAALLFIISAIEASAKTNINNKESSHSFYLSWLLFMCGIPLIFGVWLPLIAVPGAWVTTRRLD